MRQEVRKCAVTGLIAFVAIALSSPVAAEDWQATWETTLADAKGSSLNIVIQPNQGFEAVVEVFKNRFPDITVTATSANPSAFTPRLVTEQQSGVYAWDAWWATASNINQVALPAGALDLLPPYLILPEVTDPANWRNPHYTFTSEEKPYVFVHTHYVSNLGIYNSDVVGGDIKEPEGLLAPNLKGKIAVRAPTRAHGGTETLAAGMKLAGEEWLRKVLVDQEPIYVDNARQVTDGVMRGDYAVGIGITEEPLTECWTGGGCQNVQRLPMPFVASRAVAVPKNPPHPEAVKVFLNWLLSKEGQEIYVREWARFNDDGAHSMRKDVAPDPSPSQLASVPDFGKLDDYVATSLDSGWTWMERVMKVFNEVRAR